MIYVLDWFCQINDVLTNKEVDWIGLIDKSGPILEPSPKSPALICQPLSLRVFRSFSGK